MESNLLLVHKSILPKNYLQVIETRELIEKNNLSVTLACKQIGISRNTYYKYKDFVFRPNIERNRKAILSFRVLDNVGVLSNILQTISNCHGNVITINQEQPLQGVAFIFITINVNDISITMDELVIELKKIDGLKAVNILAYE